MINIYVDMDDVVCDLMTPWLNWCNDKYGTDYKTISNWNVQTMPGWDEEVYEYLHLPGTFANLLPVPGAIQTLNELHERGYNIEFISAAIAGHDDKYKWIQKFLPWVDRRQCVHFTHRKYMFAQDANDILIDDKPQNCEEWTLCGGRSIMFSRPHNRDVAVKGPMTSDAIVATWQGVKDMIENFVLEGNAV